jgi:alpha-glucosidase
MTDVDVPRDRQQDPQGLRGGESRDAVRSPMRWDASPLAGFSQTTPWLPIGPDADRLNVATERADPHSILLLYRRLLALRRAEPALNTGEWHALGRTDSSIAYLRASANRRFLIVANLTPREAPVPASATALSGRVLVSTLEADAGARFDGSRSLGPDEALVVELGRP